MQFSIIRYKPHIMVAGGKRYSFQKNLSSRDKILRNTKSKYMVGLTPDFVSTGETRFLKYNKIYYLLFTVCCRCVQWRSVYTYNISKLGKYTRNNCGEITFSFGAK